MNQILTQEKEIELLKNIFALAQLVNITGSKQAGILATIGDNVVAVGNSLSAKLEALKQRAQAEQVLEQSQKCCQAKPDLSLVEKPTNGEVLAEKPAAH